jgi:hypothetical protein
MSTTFTSPFTGTVVQPTDVSYYSLQFSTNTQLYWPAVVNPTQVPAARIIDCTPENPGLAIELPQGNQGSVGTDILFRNFGSNSFVVTNFSGGSAVTVAPGIAVYFYLSDNTTINGVWENVTFGAGTSAVDAATLAGYGLTTVNVSGVAKLAVTGNPIQITSIPTLNDASRAVTYVWESGNATWTLPSVNSLSTGWWIGFRNNGTGTITIQPQGTAQINNQVNITVNPGDSGFLLYDANAGTPTFFTVGLANPSSVTFTSSTYDVDSITGSTLNLVSYAPIVQTYVALSGTRTALLNVVLPAITQIYVLVNNTTINLSFLVSGGTTPFTVPPNTISTVLSDGVNIYSLTSAATNSFIGGNGTVTVPTFTFTSDPSTGMYLVGTHVLALTANGTQIMRFDGTNPSSLQVNTAGTLTAGLITGGIF